MATILSSKAEVMRRLFAERDDLERRLAENARRIEDALSERDLAFDRAPVAVKRRPGQHVNDGELTKDAVLRVLRSHPLETLELWRIVSESGKHREAVRQALYKLRDQGSVRQVSRGEYQIGDATPAADTSGEGA